MNCPEISNVRESYYGTFNMNNALDFGCQGFYQANSDGESFNFLPPQLDSIYTQNSLKLNAFDYL